MPQHHELLGSSDIECFPKRLRHKHVFHPSRLDPLLQCARLMTGPIASLIHRVSVVVFRILIQHCLVLDDLAVKVIKKLLLSIGLSRDKQQPCRILLKVLVQLDNLIDSKLRCLFHTTNCLRAERTLLIANLVLLTVAIFWR